MTRTGSPRHSIAPLPRRLSIGHDHARRRDAPSNQLVDQSPLRAASFGYRNRPTKFTTPSTVPKQWSTHADSEPPATKSP